MSIRQAVQWFVDKYKRRQAEVGTYATALQMRKQGVPLEVTLAILVRG